MPAKHCRSGVESREEVQANHALQQKEVCDCLDCHHSSSCSLYVTRNRSKVCMYSQRTKLCLEEPADLSSMQLVL